MNTIKISVCIGVYNREKYIKDCLESIINQTYKNIEILISDNASTDRSMEIAEEVLSKSDCDYKIFKQDVNRGPDFNYKFLSGMATGDYVALFHSDDVYHKEIIRKSIESYKENKSFDVGIVLSLSNIQKKRNEKYSLFTYKQTLKYLLFRRTNPFNCPTAVWRKDVLSAFDFENRYPEANDLLGYVKILRQNKVIIVVNEELHFYRAHEGQDSAFQNKKYRYSYSAVYKIARDFIKQDKIISLYLLLFISWIYEKLRYLKRLIEDKMAYKNYRKDL